LIFILTHWDIHSSINRQSLNSSRVMLPKILLKMRIEVPILREILAEFLGTFILVIFGDASVAQSKLTDGKNGDFFAINWGWGIGVMMGVLVAGGVSGAHLNPAVSLAMAVIGKFPLRKVLFYWLAQYLGALAAAASVLGVYSDAIQQYSNGTYVIDDTMNDPGLAGIFATYPAAWLSIQGGMGDQILGTMLLLLCICAITDKKNTQVPTSLVPMYVGFLILAIGICFGANCGYALNPARDLAPRLLTLMAGWGTKVFSYKNYTWFWIPIIGPHIGSILGVTIYTLFIEAHWPTSGEDVLPGTGPDQRSEKHLTAVAPERA